MKQLFIVFWIFIAFLPTQAQILNPVKWSYKIEKITGNEYKLIYTANVEKGWTVYSQFTSDDGPVPTSVNYDQKDGIQLIGKATESGAKKEGMDSYFGVNVIKFLSDKPFVIEQKIKVTDPSKPIVGYVNFMACDKEKCLPPSDAEFTFTIPKSDAAPTKETTTAKPEVGIQVVEETKTVVVNTTPADSQAIISTDSSLVNSSVQDFPVGAIINGDRIDQKVPSLASTYENPLSNCGGTEEKKEGLFWTFIFGLLGGFIALLTPCVFPMLPITVSFFTKDTKRKGWVNGLIYGVSIIVIYVLIGLLITIFVGPEALNRLSTNWIANTLFFIIFIAFAFSFFGYY